jgi:hypothetical protein
LDAYLTSQAVAAPVSESPPQDEQDLPAKEEPESLIRGKGLTVEELVAEQGGNPAKAVHEGMIEVEIVPGETRYVATYTPPLPDPSGEEVKVPEPPEDDKQIDEKENQPEKKE